MVDAPSRPVPAEPAFGPEECSAGRERLGLSIPQAARRTGLTEAALERFEAGEDGLAEAQVAALRRVLGAPPARQAPRGLLDLGPVCAAILLLGGAIPLVAALVAGANALRFLDSEMAEARVVGFEHRLRTVDPEEGERYTIEVVAPLLRFIRPDGGGEATIAWRETLPEQVPFTQGDVVRLVVPRGAPDRAEMSIAEFILRPFIFAAMAAPLLIIGLVALGHWRRRRQGLNSGA